MNENANSVMCDYCGEEMKLIWTACYSERKGGFFQFQCPKCLACTPRVKTQVDYYKEKPSDKELEEGREAAYDAAMKREKKCKTYAEDFKEHFGYSWNNKNNNWQCRGRLYNDIADCVNSPRYDCEACWNEEMEDEDE